MNIVSNTNKNNIAYTTKIREASEEVDVMVERAELNVNVFSDNAVETYDTTRLNNKKYNEQFLNANTKLIKSILINTPGAQGAWFQISAELPFSPNSYIWYCKENGKIIDYKNFFDKYDASSRKLTPEDDPYYFAAIENKKITWSPIYKDKDTNVELISVSKPIYKNNKLIGVIGVDISTKDLKTAMNNIQNLFPSSNIFLLNHKNNILIAKMQNNSGKVDENLIEILSRIKNISDKNMLEYTKNGQRITALIIPMSNQYNIVIEFINSKMYAGFTRLFNTVYIIFLLLILFSLKVIVDNYRILKINKKNIAEKDKLRVIFESIPNLVFVKGLDGTYLECNNMVSSILGLKKQDVIGKKDTDFFSGELLEDILESERIVKETKKTLVKEVFLPAKFNLPNTYLEKFIVPLFDAENTLSSIFILCIDVTKKKEEHRLLMIAKENAEKTAAMKSNFLANMSHEIRTPMNGVLGFIQLLKETNLTDEQLEFIEHAQISSEMLLKIINDVLDFSKIDAGKMNIENSSFDISELIEETTTMSISGLNNNSLSVNSIISSEIPQIVIGDPLRVRQILSNLINNAVKFTQSGKVITTLSKISEDAENITLKIEVKDTGIGIEKDKLEYIFEEFSQVDASSTRSFGGTGLGLAITKRLVELLGGTISVESRLSCGSIFTVNLPFKKDLSKGDSQEQNLLDNSTIILIGHNEPDAKVIKHYLNEKNCNTIFINSYNEIITLIEPYKDNISAIIIDEDLKDYSNCGVECFTQMHEKLKHIPFVLSESSNILHDPNCFNQFGFSSYFKKPIKRKELFSALEKAIFLSLIHI